MYENYKSDGDIILTGGTGNLPANRAVDVGIWRFLFPRSSP